MDKLIKSARVLDVFAKIIFIFCIVAFCMVIAANIFVLALPEESLPDNLSLVLDFSDNDFVVLENGQINLTKQQLVVYILAVSVTAATEIAILTIGVKLFRRILSPMKEGRPFEEGISDVIRKFGHFVLAATVISGFIQLVLAFVFERLGAIPADDVGISVDGIFAAILIYLMSYIFRYGEELQKQADETL